MVIVFVYLSCVVVVAFFICSSCFITIINIVVDVMIVVKGMCSASDTAHWSTIVENLVDMWSTW